MDRARPGPATGADRPAARTREHSSSGRRQNALVPDTERSSDAERPSSGRQLAWLALIAAIGFVVVYFLIRDPWGLFFEDRR